MFCDWFTEESSEIFKHTACITSIRGKIIKIHVAATVETNWLICQGALGEVSKLLWLPLVWGFSDLIPALEA